MDRSAQVSQPTASRCENARECRSTPGHHQLWERLVACSAAAPQWSTIPRQSVRIAAAPSCLRRNEDPESTHGRQIKPVYESTAYRWKLSFLGRWRHARLVHRTHSRRSTGCRCVSPVVAACFPRSSGSSAPVLAQLPFWQCNCQRQFKLKATATRVSNPCKEVHSGFLSSSRVCLHWPQHSSRHTHSCPQSGPKRLSTPS